MTDVQNDRLERDPFRERELQDRYGIDAEVRWLGPEMKASVVIDVKDLDHLIGSRSGHGPTGNPTRSIDDIRQDGYNQAVKDLRKLDRANKRAAKKGRGK